MVVDGNYLQQYSVLHVRRVLKSMEFFQGHVKQRKNQERNNGNVLRSE